jgi:hypothetical protein
LEPNPSTYSFTTVTTGCPESFAGKFSFNATLTNVSDKWLTNLAVECAELTNDNLLLTNHGLLGEGEWFPITRTDDYEDGLLSPEEFVNVPFTVCCKKKEPFRFYVDILGVTFDLEDGLVAYYPFNGNANDESSNGNHGIVYGATLTEDRFGEPNSAYSFDGADDYVEVPGPLSFSELTFSVWLKIPRVDIRNNKIFTIDEGGGHYYALRGNYAYALRLRIHGKEVSKYDWSFLPNMWTHIAVTYDGLTLKVYKDGVITDSGVIDGDPISGPLFIGGVPAPNYGARIWDGMIDDTRIYNRVLTQAEIEALYNLSN